MASLLILGAGYLGAATARLALARGDEVTLADNWQNTRREQVERLGARVADCDIRDRSAVDALLAEGPDRLLLLAAQASRPVADRDPEYTEETNLLGTRRVAEAVAAAGVPVVFGSSLHVYGGGLAGEIGPQQPYGEQGDLAHLSKVYGELCLKLHARRHGFALAIARLAIVYGPSPVEHEETVTVVDRFRRLAARGEPLTLDDGGRATIGVAHVDDVARILLETEPEAITAENVVAETITVAGVAALAEGRPPSSPPGWTYTTPHRYEHRVADYLAASAQGSRGADGVAP